MKFIMRSVIVLVACGCAGRAFADGPDLLLPSGKARARVRLDVSLGGKPADAAWNSFLAAWFNYFARDGDGDLSLAEAARVFALPGPDGRTIVPKFANQDGRVTRAELKAFYRRAGFTPVLVTTTLTSAHARRMSDALFRQLDTDHSGRLTR